MSKSAKKAKTSLKVHAETGAGLVDGRAGRAGTEAPTNLGADVLHLTQPAYGGDWNPTQWDAETVAEDLAMMREAGVTLVTLPVFSWTMLEPEPGRFELDWLADLIDQTWAAGIRVDLATPTAAPPAWMAHDYPESLPVDKNGVVQGFGSRQQYCPSSAVFAKHQIKLVHRMVKRFGDHPGVACWHLSNEYACESFECYCDKCAVKFREWLMRRYGDLDGLNKAWGTQFWSQVYTDWAQITPPRAMPTFRNPAQALDWRRFSSDQYLSAMEREVAIIRAGSDRPLTTNFMGPHFYLNYRDFAKHIDFISEDSYPDPADQLGPADVAFRGDLARGYKHGAPWILMEQATGAVQWRHRNSPKRPGQFRLWSMARIAHGADGILQFQWRQSKQGSEMFHSGMVPHAGRASHIWDDVVGLGADLAKLAPVVGTRTHADVAVVVDWESEWARACAVGPVPAGLPFGPAMAWHRTFWEAGIAVDVIGVDDPVDHYRAVVVPALFIDHPELSARLEAAATAGTQVLVAGPTGVIDRDFTAVLGGYVGSLRDLLGVRVLDHAALTGPDQRLVPEDPRGHLVDRISRAVSAPAGQTWAGLEAVSAPLVRAANQVGSPAPDLQAGMWLEQVGSAKEDPTDFDGVHILAVFDGRGGGADLRGMPAITRREVGEGAAWYVGASLDEVTRSVVVRALCAYARVQPVVANLPDGVEAQRRGDFLFLLNHGDKQVEIAGVTGTDVLSTARVTGHVVLAPRSAAVVDQRSAQSETAH